MRAGEKKVWPMNEHVGPSLEASMDYGLWRARQTVPHSPPGQPSPPYTARRPGYRRAMTASTSSRL